MSICLFFYSISFHVSIIIFLRFLNFVKQLLQTYYFKYLYKHIRINPTFSVCVLSRSHDKHESQNKYSLVKQNIIFITFN